MSGAQAMYAAPNDTDKLAGNRDIAELLRQISGRLEEQGANHFRVLAYAHAADTVDALQEPVADVLARGGRDGLIALPAIGRGIAAVIEEFLHTGRTTALDRLDGAADAGSALLQIPGVGPAMAELLHEKLGVDSLEDLERVAAEGRLQSLPGIGPRREAAIRMSLASLLNRRVTQPLPEVAPSVAELLAVDAEYRQQAAAGSLHKIAPRRLNPEREAWLPVLHRTRSGWHFTALYSNTARAHELGRTHDWVVIYYADEDHREGQATVVTETRGPLQGQRVVRGREHEPR